MTNTTTAGATAPASARQASASARSLHGPWQADLTDEDSHLDQVAANWIAKMQSAVEHVRAQIARWEPSDMDPTIAAGVARTVRRRR